MQKHTDKHPELGPLSGERRSGELVCESPQSATILMKLLHYQYRIVLEAEARMRGQ